MIGMVEFDYHVKDNFDARHLYYKAVFFAKIVNYKGAEVTRFDACNKDHSWEETEIKIGRDTVILRLETPHSGGKREFAKETLKIKFEGDEKTRQSSKRKLEELTGIRILEESRI